MTAFWIIAAAMVCAACLLVIPALFRRPNADVPPRRQQNIDIARERINALEAEAANGTMTGAEYEQRRAEVERALYEDLAGRPQATGDKKIPAASRWTAAVLIVAVPLLAGALYFYVGNQDGLNVAGMRVVNGAPAGKPSAPSPSIQDMVARLATRLEQQPDDAEGWLMLGRSYMVMNRYREAADAFGRARALIGDNPSVLLLSARALAMSNEGRLAGRPAELIQQALILNANEPMALWLAGMAASERGNDSKALDYWRRLWPVAEKDSAASEQLAALIGQAEQRLGIAAGTNATAQPANDTQPTDANGAAISVTVALAPKWVDQVATTDTVFVFARAVRGPPMPLAIVRKQVKDLPLKVTLNDGMAMMPAMKISNFPEVQILARISKSGQATPQSGDLQGVASSVTVGRTEPVQIVIDEKIP